MAGKYLTKYRPAFIEAATKKEEAGQEIAASTPVAV